MAPWPIEDGVPIPRARRGRVAGSTNAMVWGFARLLPGQSFAVPAAGKDPYQLHNRIASAASHYGAKSGRAFITRHIILPDGARVIRIWRTA